MNKITLKTLGIISKIYGLLGATFGLMFLFIMSIQRIFFKPENFPAHPKIDFPQYFATLNKIWLIYMPFMILIGCLYFLAGYYIAKDKKNGGKILILSSILNIIWFALYAIASKVYILPLTVNAFSPNTFMISYIFTGLIMCGYPVFLLIYLPFVKE